MHNENTIKQHIFVLEYDSPVETLFLGDFDYRFIKFEELICNALHFESALEADGLKCKMNEYHPHDLKIVYYKLNEKEYSYERGYVVDYEGYE